MYGDVATNCVKSGLWFHARDFLLCTTKVIHLSCISVYTVFLICISLINGNAEHLFVPVNHPDVFSGENIYLGSCPFLWLGFYFFLSCMNCSYILEIHSLLQCLRIIFFFSVAGCLFILLMGSFAVQKLLILIRSHLFIFAFISFALGDWSKTILPQFMLENIMLMFSSRSFNGLMS